MTGFIKTMKKSAYLKFMLTIYLVTLCLLVSYIINIPGIKTVTGALFKLSTNRSSNEAYRQGALKIRDIGVTTNNSISEHTVGGRVRSHCKDTSFPIKHVHGNTWLKIDPTGSCLVFSAYYDERNAGWIKIIGLITKRPPSHFCQLWYRNEESKDIWMNVTKAAITKLHSSPPKYTACFIKCRLPDSRIPYAVSVVSESNCTLPDGALYITHIPKVNYTRNFTVCLCPLNFRYGRAYELVEWIELNLILGANKFVIYNYSSAVNVRSVLEHYNRLGIVDIVQWHLPISVNKWPQTKDPVEVHYFAQTSALNDCLLKSKGESEFVVNLDLDEFIIPHKNNTFSWQDIIGGLPRSGAYIFRNSFFRKEWTRKNLKFQEKKDAEKYKLVSLLKVEREAKVWLPRQRSKYIARTSDVEIIVTHDISSMLNRQKPLSVDPNLALLHHYRNWLKYNDTQTRVVDKTVIDKYSKVIVERVASTWSKLKNVKMDIPMNQNGNSTS